MSDSRGMIVVIEGSPNKSVNTSRSGIGYVFAARYMVPSDVFFTIVVIGAICDFSSLLLSMVFRRKVIESNQGTLSYITLVFDMSYPGDYIQELFRS
jgi:hypothetical protein